MQAIEQAYPVAFASYFAAELEKLGAMAEDGLVTVGDDWISVTPKGRMVIRNICMVFDRYLGQNTQGPRFSRTV
jgi:oxygen-independent coproporphyrinogen-3 oxidase